MPRRRAKLIAWTLSIGLHLALALVLIRDDVGRVRTLPLPSAATRECDSEDEPAFSLAVERTVETAPPTAQTIAPQTGQRPVEPPRPEAISANLKQLISELGSRPAARIEVQDVSPIEYREPVNSAQPAGPSPAPKPTEPSFGRGQALHGRLPAGKSVVYLLDRSTSIGLTRETFDAARAATLASVAALPAETKFQVIAYGGQPTRLLPGAELLKKSADHEGQLGAALVELKPEGDSHHDRALRAALALGADYLIIITDAGEEELAGLRPILKGHGKPVSLSVVRVDAGTISPPRPFR